MVYSGECELSVLVNGGHVRGSPFAVKLAAAILQNGHWVMTRSATALGAIRATAVSTANKFSLWCYCVSSE